MQVGPRELLSDQEPHGITGGVSDAVGGPGWNEDQVSGFHDYGFVANYLKALSGQIIVDGLAVAVERFVAVTGGTTRTDS